jgi:hypothetical protein
MRAGKRLSCEYNTKTNKEPNRRRFIEKLGQAFTKPVIFCQSKQKSIPKRLREKGYKFIQPTKKLILKLMV